MQQADRMQSIQPFHVMALLARARELEAQGRSIVHMEIGEPDFVTPQPVIDAGIQALRDGHTHYTPAVGMFALRERIAAFYRERYGVTLDPQRVVITPGASAALQLVMAVLVNAGDEVLMADPGYPCNRNFVYLLGGIPVGIPVGAASVYQPTAKQVGDYWSDATRALLVASPSNPTGTLLGEQTLRDYHAITGAQDGSLIVDEIYHGLVYDGQAVTALAVSEDIFVINSFSKYFGMTGWRLGWLVAPVAAVAEMEKLAQNLFISMSTMAQYAALAAFEPATREILDQRRDIFRRRRDYLLPAVQEVGFHVTCKPQGAFYIYADASRFTDDSQAFCLQLLEEHGVALTPGVDFGRFEAGKHLRFSYTTGMDRLELAVERLSRVLG